MPVQHQAIIFHGYCQLNPSKQFSIKIKTVFIHENLFESVVYHLASVSVCWVGLRRNITWWRHQMEPFAALLALCAGNSPATGEFPTQSSVTQSFYVFYNLAWTNSKVNSRDAVDLRCHRPRYDVIVMIRRNRPHIRVRYILISLRLFVYVHSIYSQYDRDISPSVFSPGGQRLSCNWRLL